MDKIIGVTELQRRFSTVFDEVVENRTPYILTRGSRPEAAIIPYELYVQYLKAYETDVHARFDAMLAQMAVHNAKYTDEEVERDVLEAERIVRARRRVHEPKQGYRVTTKPKQSRKSKK